MGKSVLIETVSVSKTSHSKKHLDHLIRSSELKGIVCERLSPIYRLEGNLNDAEIKKIASELLCDRIVEKFVIDALPDSEKELFLDIWYKPGVTDVVGESVRRAARDLNIDSVEKAFSGTRIRFHAASSLRMNGNSSIETKIALFANRELLNPLVQECKIIKR
jgi:phosphoribosylformylglycinamidine (FGAM) synthase PurS component